MNELFIKVKNLKFPAGKYAIFGSGPIAIRGLRKCKDIDIIVTEDVFNDYKKRSEWKLKKFDDNADYLDKDGVELWKEWGPGEWDVNKLIKEAEIIDGLPFVILEETLRWKQINGRPKDLEDIELIKEYLANKKLGE